MTELFTKHVRATRQTSNSLLFYFIIKFQYTHEVFPRVLNISFELSLQYHNTMSSRHVMKRKKIVINYSRIPISQTSNSRETKIGCWRNQEFEILEVKLQWNKSKGNDFWHGSSYRGSRNIGIPVLYSRPVYIFRLPDLVIKTTQMKHQSFLTLEQAIAVFSRKRPNGSFG